MISLIIFDCDGVIVDSELIGNRVGAEVKTEFGIPMSTEEHMERFIGCSPIDPAYLELFKKIDPSKLDAFKKATIERRDAAFAADLQANPGVRALIETLPSLGIKHCLASNGTFQKMSVTLKLTKLSDLFENKIFSSELVKEGKPAPDLFLYAANAMNCRPQECLVIEDSPKGIQAARAAGMKVFAYTGGSHFSGHDFLLERLTDATPDGTFKNMADLPTLLRSLF